MLQVQIRKTSEKAKMETYQKRMRRHSHSVLQDIIIKGFRDEGRDIKVRQNRPQGHGGQRSVTPTYHHSLDNIITHKGNLIRLTGNNAVEIYKPSKQRQSAIREGLSDIYLPAITGKMSNLQSARAKLSHSCPYLATSRRRGSTSSINSQRAPDFNKQSYLQEQKESKRSNVTVTMMYLGQGLPGDTLDEMKVLQQICGGENICVFKGFVRPGEQFQFISQRHLGFPFSASIFVNGMMAARISSCCEYRYGPGFQQGRGSCFRLTRLNGGKPCYKCVNSRHGIGFPAINTPSPTFQRTINSNEGSESCSSPLFMPLGMERSVQKTKKLSKEGGVLSTDSEDLNGSVKQRRRHKVRHKVQSSQQADGKGSEEDSQPSKDANVPEVKPASSITRQELQTSANKHMQAKDDLTAENKAAVPDSLQEGKTQNKHNGEQTTDPRAPNGKSRNKGRLRDFYEECVEISTGLESGLDQQRWFKANKIERNRIKDQLTSAPSVIGSASEVELSEESDSGDARANTRKPKMNNKQGIEIDTLEKEQDLQKQMDAMTEVLNNSDEVEQLVLRNTGLTDDLFEGLAMALKRSPSEVTVINLNLNHIGPTGVRVLLDLLHAKPQIKELLLFGNRLGDLGVQNLLGGLAELHDISQNSFFAVGVAIKELDLGGNGVGSDGLRVLATFMRYHSRLQYLGLAQTTCSDMEAWKVLFESLKVNAELAHIILDECNLGDSGVKLFTESLRSNEALRKVDLDNNGFGEAGGHYLLEALSSRGKCPLEHLSLEGNYISMALMTKIQQEVESSRSAHV